MIRKIYTFEIITPCFCGGAEPDQRAEIRAASIRGQLRWWFRVLGGFKSLDPQSVREQECLIFGSAAGDEGTSGALRLQVLHPVASTTRKNTEDFNAGVNTDLGYALFPLRPITGNDSKRGVLSEGTQFSLTVTWRGDARLWQEIVSLLVVWANLGSLGFRSRRTAGAIKMNLSPKPLENAFQSFRQSIIIQSIPIPTGGTWRSTSEALLRWYRGWRQHGRSQDLRPGNRDKRPPENDGFAYAQRDHDIGYQLPALANQPAFRPALGLPIIQRTNRGTKNWAWSNNGGRFASPVILRPHKDARGNWHALILFVDALQWPVGKQVYLDGRPRAVSLDLYEAMKADPALQPFV